MAKGLLKGGGGVVRVVGHAESPPPPPSRAAEEKCVASVQSLLDRMFSSSCPIRGLLQITPQKACVITRTSLWPSVALAQTPVSPDSSNPPLIGECNPRPTPSTPFLLVLAQVAAVIPDF